MSSQDLSNDVLLAALESREDACGDDLVANRDEQQFEQDRFEGRIAEVYMQGWFDAHEIEVHEIEKNHGPDMVLLLDTTYWVEIKGRNMDNYDRDQWDDRRDLLVRLREELDSEDRRRILSGELADLYVLVTYSIEERWVEIEGWATSGDVEEADWLYHPYTTHPADGNRTPTKILCNDSLRSFDGVLQ